MKASLLLLLISSLAQAGFWLNADQAGLKALRRGQFEQASVLFKEPEWKAVANYRAGKYKLAAEQFKDDYNRGNALAHLGQYEAAIKAYQKKLIKNPEHKDTIYNKKILENLLKNKKTRHQDSKKNTTKSKQQAQPKPLTNRAREQANLREQLLRRVPDNPGGLLRQKFRRDHLRYQQAGLYQEMA